MTVLYMCNKIDSIISEIIVLVLAPARGVASRSSVIKADDL